MINAGKHNVLGILMHAVDYEAAVEFALRAAHQKHGAAVSALALHGLITGVLDKEQKDRLNDNTLIMQYLGWEPNTSLRAGLEKTYRWIYDQYPACERGKKGVIRQDAVG
jgi:dTDP-D-glucose 4,6-dehydratase